MSEYPEHFEKMANRLPKEQHEEALCIMRKAHLDGIEHIGLWTGEEPPDISDLFGNCPKKRKALRQQGDEWSSGLISLEKYNSKNTQ